MTWNTARAYVDAALDIHRRARAKFPNVAVCVQAYAQHRTEKDVESLIAQGANVRLVKGAYDEPSEIAFPRKSDGMKIIFGSRRCAGRGGAGPAPRRTRDARPHFDPRELRTGRQQEIPRDRLEFDMLYGIQRAEQLRLVREGYRCRVLVSYGSYWFPWFMRRLAERPANFLFLARNLWGG